MKYDRYTISKRKLNKLIDEHIRIENEAMRKDEYPEVEDASINRLEDWYTGGSGSHFSSFSKPSKIVGHGVKQRLVYVDKKGRFITSPLTDYLKEKDRLLYVLTGTYPKEHIRNHGRLLVVKMHRDSVRNYLRTKRLQSDKSFRRKRYKEIIHKHTQE